MRDDFDRVVGELLAQRPGVAVQSAEALARTLVGSSGTGERVEVQSPRAIVDADLSPRCLALAIDAGCLAIVDVVIAGLIYIAMHRNPPFPTELILPVVAAEDTADEGCTQGKASNDQHDKTERCTRELDAVPTIVHQPEILRVHPW